MNLIIYNNGRFDASEATLWRRGRRIEWRARRDGDVWAWRVRERLGWRRFIPTAWRTGDQAAMFRAYRNACARVGLTADPSSSAPEPVSVNP